MPNRIGAILEHQGRSVTWAARRVGCTREYLTEIIAGRARPSDEMRQRIAIALDLPLDVLFVRADCLPEQTAEPVPAPV